MINKNLMWKVVSKEEFPDLVFYGLHENVPLKGRFNESDLNKGMIAVGYDTKNKLRKNYSPEIIVIDDDRISDFFSWLTIYAAEIFPVSQFARCISLYEWKLSEAIGPVGVSSLHKYQLACVIAGEMVSQIDGNFNLGDIPLSSAFSTYSLPIAQSISMGDFQDCKAKLEKISSDRRFGESNFVVPNIFYIWECIYEYLDGSGYAPLDVSIRNFLRKMANGSGFSRNELLTDTLLTELFSDSVEQRVITFYKVVEILKSDQRFFVYPLSSLELAAAAFLVGRGTTHMFLLKELSGRFPESFVWFGVIAGLVGLDSWDEVWLRLIKGVEKSLTYDNLYFSAQASDVCWIEYEWIASVAHKDLLEGVQKITGGVVAIELALGVVYRVNLAGKAFLSKDGSMHQLKDVVKRNEELLKIISDYVRISKRAESILTHDKNYVQPVGRGYRKNGNKDFFE